MRVSERLQQNLWASALVMSLAVIQSPSAAFGQDNFPAGFPPASSSTGAFAPTGMQRGAGTATENELAEARRFLLRARQALAHSDVETARAMANAAKQFSLDFEKVGDSPSNIEAMINRQLDLADLARRISVADEKGQSALANTDGQAYSTGAASFLLSQAEALIHFDDFDTATNLISRAREFPVEFTAAVGNPDRLEQMIELGRNNRSVAPTTAVAVRTLDPSKKSETMKLLSQAQLAMDQGKWDIAKRLVDQAKFLDVPQNEFAANDPRPWQLELKIQTAMNRQSLDGGVARASFDSQIDDQASQASYDPGADNTKNIMASSTEAWTPATTDFNPEPVTAPQLYRQGLAALSQKDPVAARALFTEAWNNRDQLDPATIQSLQDQLTRLTMSSDSAERVTQASGTMELDDTQLEAQALYRKLQLEVFAQREAAEKLMTTDPRGAMEVYVAARGRIAQSRLDANTQRHLLNMIDKNISVMQQYIEENLAEIENEETNIERMNEIEFRNQHRDAVEKQIQKLVQQFNDLVDEQRFEEALQVARQANDLSPDSVISVLLKEKAQIIRNLRSLENIRDVRADMFLRNINAAEESATPNDPNKPEQFGDPEAWIKNSNIRLGALEERRYESEVDRRIWNTLKNQRVSGEFRSSLAEAMNDLALQAGINIIFDDLALVAENVNKDRAIDIPIREPISLQSALEVILQSAGLVFVVENEVIKVTSKNARQAKKKVKTYYIGDLVMPMAPPKNPMAINFNYPQMNGTQAGNMNVANTGGTSQGAMAQQLGNGIGQGNAFGGFGQGGGFSGGPQYGRPMYGTVGAEPLGGITLLDFIPLIDLIQNTIAVDSWEDTGTGLGTIQAFPNNLSLIISQTQEVQDEIQDLLKKLRELNDVQIVVEVRFITLRDSFFERVGIDFDFSINENSAVLNPNGDVQTNGSTIVGRAPVDTTPYTPTSDLDLQFLQGSFSAAEPVFGGFSAASAATFGFAILSDIEVFFLIQASKGDSRTNITQAPTVTMFNGQSASISDGSTRPFVTSVIPVVGDFAVAHQPVITLLPDGTNLNVTAVVSADRRFVRLQLVPFFSQVTEVKTFTFNGSTSTKSVSNSVLDELVDAIGGGDDDDDDLVLETSNQGITIQLPVLAGTTLNTVVSVPDGGTVLMGGVKRMSEGRQEAGVPFLSNLPYINRLFKNVGIGQETSNLMMMVTPRIIIQKEIEEAQTGYSSPY